MATFKKKALSAEAVALAESVAAGAPIVGDPRMAPLSQDDQLIALATNLGPVKDSSQAAASAVSISTDARSNRIVHVPLSKVRSNPLNPRAVYTNAAVDEMAVSLSQHGQRIAALGYLEDDGQVVLIEGETRLRGARAAGLETLRIELRPKPASDRELYESARAANVERRDQTPLDDALRWKELLSRKIYPNQTTLAKALGLGEDQVSRTLSLATLPPRLIFSVAENPELLTLRMLNALREFYEQQGEEETLELIHQAAKEGLGAREVIARRKAATKGPINRPRSVRDPVEFNNAKGEIKTFNDDGRLELVLRGLTEAEARRLVEGIKSLLRSAG